MKDTKGRIILFSIIGLLIGFILGVLLTPTTTGDARASIQTTYQQPIVNELNQFTSSERATIQKMYNIPLDQMEKYLSDIVVPATPHGAVPHSDHIDESYCTGGMTCRNGCGPQYSICWNNCGCYIPAT
jgi:hypothetical protein